MRQAFCAHSIPLLAGTSSKDYRSGLYHPKLDKVYRGIPNVMGIANNHVVCGSSEQEHNKAFTEMLKATRKCSVSLNSKKNKTQAIAS